MSDTRVAPAPFEPSPAAPARILEPGRNCWRVERADRFCCVQDAAAYFRLVRRALLEARDTVFILGWDIWSHVDLVPDAPSSNPPSRFDQLLVSIARRRPNLRCYVLIWDYGALYTLERDPLARWRLGWRTPRGIRFGFDDRHPIGASHHQKVIVIDDQLAFCGGIDLTGHRWDTSAHRVHEPARLTAVGAHYGPYHEVQAMMTGPVAAALGELARDRWRRLGEGGLPATAPSSRDQWPDDVEPDLVGVDVGIARTMPACDGRSEVRECEALFEDSIARARRTIYIENQYFSNESLAAALAARLRDPDGPEVIVVEPRDCHGWLEQQTMGVFRSRAHRLLIDGDRHGRLRLVHPLASRRDDAATFVHSKVMVVDDVLVRIGSANLSHRSMGMDSECDVAAEAGDDADQRAAIRGIRDRLLAEHLGMSVDAVAHEIDRAGSVRAVIDARINEDRTLAPLPPPTDDEEPSDVLRAAADPDEPIAFGPAIDDLVPRMDARVGADPIRVWLMPSVALAAVAVVAGTSIRGTTSAIGTVRRVQRTWRRDPAALRVGVAGASVAGAVFVPVEVLSLGAGVVFGGVTGSLVAFVGSCVAAGAGYLLGRLSGPRRVSRWTRARDYRSARQIGTRGAGGVVALRLAGVASTGAVSLVCGAGRVPVGTYLVGTALGLIPLVVPFGGLGALLGRTAARPSRAAATLTVGATVVLTAAATLLRAFFVVRQFAPTMSRHRDRAEFG